MAYYTENFGNQILELLNYPLMNKCPELGIMFDRCSNIRDLQEIFPILVDSIFGLNGGSGWGLRTISKEANPQDFEILYNFFIPLGPMFRLCYRLLNDGIKFEFSTELLPHKINEMLQSGRYSIFYADLVNVDPFRRCITSLSLNAFDYFMLNFVIYGTIPMHRMFPAALTIHNEKLKTAYFFLTADYLCSFLPSNPDVVVMPTNISSTVKAPQPIPVQPLQPTRSPKYLNLSPISHFATANKSQTSRTPESPRSYAWRTESVLYLFTDIWLRYDVDETRDLPSSEFIRVVRILIKQIHSFCNSSDIDTTPMAILRKQAQPMVNARIYPFLKSIIGRWPLDSSMSVVLELWLSYIQPWRYTFNRDLSNLNTEIPINSKYEAFISDNLIVYTQIFIQILPRFERLDFSSFRNVAMLHRLIKVFSQPALADLLQKHEEKLLQHMCAMTTPHQTSPKRAFTYGIHKTDNSLEWDSFRTENFIRDESYAYMFGDQIKTDIQQLMKKLFLAKMYCLEEIEAIKHQIKVQNRGFFKYIKHLLLSIFDETTAIEQKLNEIQKIPDVLDLATRSLSFMFEISIPEMSYEHLASKDLSYSNANFSDSENSENFDISQISPARMKNSIGSMKIMGDPALLPIQSHECSVLVRFLHQVSCKLNFMFSEEMREIWQRPDIWGKISRQLLSPPLTVQYFDKSRGFSTLQEEYLCPRICLRFLASYKTLVVIPLSLLIGHTLWGAPSLGLLILLSCIFLYIIISAIFS